MKIRIGFVSNSSSSSFCIFGIQISKEEYDKIIETNGYYEEDISNDGKLLAFEDYNATNTFYAGLDPNDMGDCETLEGFKQGIIDKLKPYIKTSVNLKNITCISGEYPS